MSTAALTLRADERWLAGASPVERLSATMASLLVASIAIHVAMVATALVGASPVPMPPREIAVEIVREVPDTKPAATKAEPTKIEPTKIEPTKIEPTKIEPAKIEPAKIEAAKVEPAKPSPAKPSLAASEPVKTEIVKPEPVKAEPPPVKAARAVAPTKPPASPPADAAADAEKAATIKAMESELAKLRAEQATLEAENAAARATAAAAGAATAEPAEARPVALRDTGLGPLPESFQVVALPSATDGAGEAVGYNEIVFSALAKAKEIGGQMGLPGTAGVHFEIDSTGRLTRVELVHPSGIAALDAQALAIVRKAAPFPPPPQGAQRSFDANVNFVTASGP